jgi:hypothetical protein
MYTPQKNCLQYSEIYGCQRWDEIPLTQEQIDANAAEQTALDRAAAETAAAIKRQADLQWVIEQETAITRAQQIPAAAGDPGSLLPAVVGVVGILLLLLTLTGGKRNG